MRQLGRTGQQVAAIGQGTWMMGDDPARERDEIAALRLGIELGMTLIDTAEMYGDGRSERLVGKAIRGLRDRVFLVTKVLPHHASFDGTLKAAAGSLKRLGTDHIDLYLLHWPSSRIPVGETMRAMERLVRDGAVRYIGVSNFTVEQLEEARQALSTTALVCNQVFYYVGERGIERRLIPYCAAQGITVMAYSPFGGQGAFPAPGSPRWEALARIGARHGKTPRQVALAWAIRQAQVVAIPKASRPQHVRENAGGAGWRLAPEDLAEIDRVFPAPDHDVPLAML